MQIAPVKPKAYSVEEIRKTFTKAYAPWTEEEDTLLKNAYEEFVKLNQPEENFISEYARKFGRKPGGIRSRITKLLNGEIVYSKKQPVKDKHHVELVSASQTKVSLPDNLSPDQRFVLDSLLSWIKNPKNGFITVDGYAGTGCRREDSHLHALTSTAL